MTNVTYKDIVNNKEFNAYIQKGNELLGVLGYTDHSSSHTIKVAKAAEGIMLSLGYSQRDAELAKIAGYIHDIGNMVNRVDHAHTGAVIALGILLRIGMDPDEVSTIVGAIGNHDEKTGLPVSPISAALIIADKADVRRSRVRNKDISTFDIHDRVNYSVESSSLNVYPEKKIIQLKIKIDTEICSVLNYFEIFLNRMLMCKRAAEFLNVSFEMIANDYKLF